MHTTVHTLNSFEEFLAVLSDYSLYIEMIYDVPFGLIYRESLQSCLVSRAILYNCYYKWEFIMEITNAHILILLH